ncbi:hypothetical protein BC826DRAFT_528883 [Russula brevipes]|nr:hypothetical protein BC826DRAFT_528883 [Russula brevipes]
MFTSMHSVAAKLAAKLAPRPKLSPTLVRIEDAMHPYDPNMYEKLAMQLYAVKYREHTVLGRIRDIGLRVFGKAKKARAQSASSPVTPTVSISESFDIPHIYITEETETPFNPIRRRARVQTNRDTYPSTPSIARDLYDASFEGENDSENVTGRPLSMFLEDFGDLDASDDHPFQELYGIQEESEHKLGAGQRRVLRG